MPLTPNLLDKTAAIPLGIARNVYLNDTNAQIWTDAVLIPFLQEAYRDLIMVLWLNGLPVVRAKTTVLTIPIGKTSMGPNGANVLPADMLEPVWLKERATGATNDEWVPMSERDFEPDLLTTPTTLSYWAWRQEDIFFPSVGASTSRDIRMNYHATLTIPVVSTDSLNYIFAESFLAPQLSGYAAGSVGNDTLAGKLLWVQVVQVGIAGSKLDMIIRANVKNQQNIPARRLPYRRSMRGRYWL